MSVVHQFPILRDEIEGVSRLLVECPPSEKNYDYLKWDIS